MGIYVCLFQLVSETATKAGSEVAPNQEVQQELKKAQEQLSKTQEELSALKGEVQKKQEEVSKVKHDQRKSFFFFNLIFYHIYQKIKKAHASRSTHIQLISSPPK